MQHRIIRSLAALALGALTVGTAIAQTTPGFKYTHLARFKEDARYEASGVVVYPREAFPAKIYDVRPHQLLRQMFPGSVTGDGNNTATSNALWRDLLNSGHVMGSASRLVRANDILEDWDVNFVDPRTPTRNHWFDFYADNVHAGQYVGYAQTLVNGPQKGARVMGNGNLLAMGDDRGMWLDADGSLSYYWRGTGALDFDSTATAFKKGPEGWAGASLSSKLKHLIGHEEGRLYFLEGDDTLHVYDRDLNFVRTDELHLSGELREVRLGEILDGKVPGATYLGWDLGPVIGFFPSQTR